MKPVRPQPIEWTEVAPVRVVRDRAVHATPDEVFAVLADHEHWPEWFTSVKRIEVTAGATGVGGGRRVHLPGVVIEEEFLAWEPGVRFAFTVVAAKPRLMRSLTEDIRLSPLPGGWTRVDYVQGWDLGPLGRVAGRLFARNASKGLEQGLEGLAARAES